MLIETCGHWNRLFGCVFLWVCECGCVFEANINYVQSTLWFLNYDAQKSAQLMYLSAIPLWTSNSLLQLSWIIPSNQTVSVNKNISLQNHAFFRCVCEDSGEENLCWAKRRVKRGHIFIRNTWWVPHPDWMWKKETDCQNFMPNCVLSFHGFLLPQMWPKKQLMQLLKNEKVWERRPLVDSPATWERDSWL